MSAVLLRRSMKTWGGACILLARAAVPVAVLGAVLGGCRSQSGGIRQEKAETPAAYTENRVYYVAPKAPAGVPGRDESRRRLYQPFELARVEAEWQAAMAAAAANGQLGEGANVAIDSGAVAHGDPLSIIVHGVRIPDSITSDVGPGPFDIAVILDVMTGTSGGEASSLVVWYQTGVPAGQMLNFRDLLVYADPAWDSAFAPYFRIRVLDVRDITATDTTLTRTLRSIGSLAAGFAGIVPSPVMPGVSIAMDAATRSLNGPTAVC